MRENRGNDKPGETISDPVVGREGADPSADTQAAEFAGSDLRGEPRVLESRLLDETVEGPSGPRYAVDKLLGAGGMGEVWLCEDRRIGRRVAMKVLRPDHGGDALPQDRFLREARVQGQLEHPSVVPVYDLDNNEAGASFFTMKRVRGNTLAELLVMLRRGDARVAAEFTQHKLLAAFAQVCLAVHYAHARGIIHRDLKPANLMLGRFGEVYVLDWGLAKSLVADASDGRLRPAVPAAHDVVDDPEGPVESRPSGDRTEAGAILGTPAYAAPEQLCGEPVDARTDVWALGAILFEILARERLNSRAGVQTMIANTISGLDARPSARAPSRNVPPELEAICVKATALDPNHRYASARELEEAVSGFLNGDRDRDARVKLAQVHEQAARAAADDALAGSIAAREVALAEIGRAVALDPESAAATALLHHLIDRAPIEPPQEVEQQLDAIAEENLRKMVPFATFFYLVPPLFVFLPLLLWMGQKNVWLTCGSFVPFVVTGLLFVVSYRKNRLGRSMPVLMAGGALCVAATSAFLGPFLFVPVLAAIQAAVFCIADPRTNPFYVVLLQCAAVLAPATLEALGALPMMHEFLPDGSLRIVSFGAALPRLPTLILLLSSSLLTIAAGGFFMARLAQIMRGTEARRLTQRWQIELLLPKSARASHRGSWKLPGTG